MAMLLDWRRAVATYHAATGKAGPRALVVAILARAALDLADGDPAAARFFLSKDYRHYLELIELPADFLPAGVTHAELRALVEGPALRAGRQCRKMPQNITL